MHPVEHTFDWYTPQEPWGAYRYIKDGGVCTGAPNGAYSLTDTLASGISRGRDASHKTDVDAYGWRPPTPYWGYEWRWSHRVNTGTPLYSYTDGTQSFGCNPWITAHSGACPWNGGNLATYRPYFADLEASAITEALAELGQATAEAAVDLIEARKTAEMVGDALENLWQDVRHVMKRKVPPRWAASGRKLIRDPVHWASETFSERWMEGRYGWQPLVLSVFDHLKLLDEAASRPMLVTARKRVEERLVGPESVQNNWEGAYWTIPITDHRQTTETKSVYVVLTMKVKDVERMTANDAGVLNPAMALWETLPFSWMADWVIGVGDYLNALSALEFLTLKGVSSTHRHVFTNERWFTPWNGGSSNLYWCNPPSSERATAGGHCFQRRVSVDVSPSVLLRSEITLTRALDAVALMGSVFRQGKTIMGLRV
jgi:hypothetical protein